jgi:thiol:disulfide interchange protein DsbA
MSYTDAGEDFMKQDRRTLIRTLALGAVCTAAAVPAAASAQPADGRDYRVLANPQPVEAAAGKIEVIEFFAYWCPHCHSLEPVLADWRKRLPGDVLFRREHVSFRETRIQQLHYALAAMGREDELAPRVFHAIHVERQRLDSAQKMAEVLGLDVKQFSAIYDSFAVRTRARRGTQLSEAYGIDGVPSLAVAGRFVTAPSMAGSNSAALKVVDHLIALSRKRG